MCFSVSKEFFDMDIPSLWEKGLKLFRDKLIKINNKTCIFQGLRTLWKSRARPKKPHIHSYLKPPELNHFVNFFCSMHVNILYSTYLTTFMNRKVFLVSILSKSEYLKPTSCSSKQENSFSVQNE